jgi:Holliday junction resolvase RusA-like endonuclease
MTRTGGVYTPKTTVDYEKLVATAWNDKYGMLALNGRLRVTINIYTDRHAKQDVDNLAKSILDGMQRAGAFADGDHQVYSLGVVKHAATTDFAAWVSVCKFEDYAD